jgi:predicted transcriptional regulator of viral defense system
MIQFTRQKVTNCESKAFAAFKRHQKLTTTELSLASGVPQKTLCFLIRRLEVYGQIKRLKRRPCRLTGRYAFEFELVA